MSILSHISSLNITLSRWFWWILIFQRWWTTKLRCRRTGWEKPNCSKFNFFVCTKIVKIFFKDRNFLQELAILPSSRRFFNEILYPHNIEHPVVELDFNQTRCAYFNLFKIWSVFHEDELIQSNWQKCKIVGVALLYSVFVWQLIGSFYFVVMLIWRIKFLHRFLFTCPLAFESGITGALRSLHWTCFSFLPLSTSFIISDQSGRRRGRLLRASIFSAFSLLTGVRATYGEKNENHLIIYTLVEKELDVQMFGSYNYSGFNKPQLCNLWENCRISDQNSVKIYIGWFYTWKLFNLISLQHKKISHSDFVYLDLQMSMLLNV